jgi:hypothetical protein
MHPRRFAFLIFASAFAFISAPAQAGPVVTPGRKLYVVKTERFDIIFPEASRRSALRLWATAESVYDEVAGKLETELPSRLPVVITPDIDTFNGYSSLVPYPHIVLYDTSLDLDWTAFRDNLRGLFLHELTHALSLQIRARWASFFSGIFGSWVLPGLVNSPQFMVEGATVSFESADGLTGRANDPLVKARVRQDILENRFKTPLEASGLHDEYPGGSIFYEYGGLFNAYLQKSYGMEKYAELWRAMGSLVLSVSLDRYEVGFYRAFHRTYGIPFRKAWADFRNSLAIGGVADPPEPLGPENLASLKGGIVGNDRSLFWTDERSRRAMSMDAETLEARALFDVDGRTAISDASPDAEEVVNGRAGARGRLLVSRAVDLPDGRDRTETLVYDLGSRRFLPETRVARMREARFFREGFVGIVSNLHNTDLVYASGSSEKVLLRGSETVMCSSPAVLDGDRVALVVSIEGRRNLGILEVDEGRLSLVLPEGDDAELFAYTRRLSVSRDRGSPRLYFNYDSDDRLYKLGLLDGDELHVETIDYSGGVLSPLEAAGRVFYVGRFSGGDRICRYPGDPSSPGRRRVAFSLERFDPEPSRAEGEATASEAGARARVEAYRPLAYANPFRMWFPFFDVNTIEESFRPFCLFVLRDPIDANTVGILAGYDSAHPFADAALSWTSGALPLALSAGLADNLVYDSLGNPERQSSASLSATLRLPVLPPIRLDAWGAWASESILEVDAKGEVFTSDRRPSYYEYETMESASSDLLGLYFNRLLIDLGLRGAYFPGEALSSSFLRLSLDLGAAFGALPVAARFFGEAFARFNVSDSEDIFGWRLGLLFDSDSGTPVGVGTFRERRMRD